jgi:N-acetylglutamate synthase-like GNAT family acetyltransferase
MAFDRLRNIFLPAGHFRIARPPSGLPHCRIRLAHSGDYDRCEEIYRANEKAHFPDGYFPRFSTWLREERALTLVAEAEGKVNAVCGVSAQEQEWRHFAALSFGMVHPSLHRCGYGTAILLARLSLVHTKCSETHVILSTAGGSESFYTRFGFKFLQSLQPTSAYREDHYVARFTARDRARCAAFLNGVVGISPELLGEKLPDFSRLNTAQPMAAADV